MMSLPKKNPSFEASDDVIACDLWFGPPPPIKNPGYTDGFEDLMLEAKDTKKKSEAKDSPSNDRPY